MLKTAVVNYLYYNKGHTRYDAEKIFLDNESHFLRVQDILGKDVFTSLLNYIKGSGGEIK